MRRRDEPAPEDLAERRAEVERLLADARERLAIFGADSERGRWWVEAVDRLEVLVAEGDGDVAAAKRAWRFGFHVVGP